MNILLCTDNNYVQHCAATIASVLCNNSNVSVFIFSTDISEENKHLLQAMVDSSKAKIQFIHIENELISDFPMSSEASNHISVATYFRLFVETKLPKSVDKVIYLDSDIIVRQSLNVLWNTPIEDFALGAVYQYNEWAVSNGTFRRLNYPENFGYFNAGVLLINLDYWRENNVSNRLLNYIRGNFEHIISHDQDTLNAVLYNEIFPLSCKWNLLPFFLEENLDQYTFPRFLNYKDQVKKELVDPTVLHFVFKPKPWESGCNHPWRKEYFNYLKFTPWNGWRPKFHLPSYIKYIFWPNILKLRRNIIQIFTN